MVQKEQSGGALPEAIRLDERNFADIVRGLPAKARMVLNAAMSLPRGSLKVRLPDGRALLVGGKAPPLCSF